MSITISKLPYGFDELEPHISQETMTFHYDRHHRGYVEKLNKLIKSTPYDSLTLEEIIARARMEGDIDILNNAAQAWNHAFFWSSMSPKGGNLDGRIKQQVNARFEDVAEFRKEFHDVATGLFGSGWVWLLLDDGHLKIIATGNAETPAATGLVPLLALDVWEHAYYLDYQNERGKFVDVFLDHLINWKFAAANIETSESKQAA